MMMKPLFLTLLALTAFAASSCAQNKSAETAQPTAVESKTSSEKAVVELTTDTSIRPDAKLPLIIDFNADWCRPCQMFAPVFEKAAEANRNRAIFMSVNVDRCQEAAYQFRVSSIPQVTILWPDGRSESIRGYRDEQEFTAQVALWLGVD